MSYKIERLSTEWYKPAITFLENIFFAEQNIPKALIPLGDKPQYWWCIRNEHEIVGTVAAWAIDSEWHWGRLAIHQKLRGMGLGKKLVLQSLQELFQLEIECITIDARDITVEMILKLGGKITGEKSDFYGPITPMCIERKDFIEHNY